LRLWNEAELCVNEHREVVELNDIASKLWSNLNIAGASSLNCGRFRWGNSPYGY
jgi:hypothetical protein